MLPEKVHPILQVTSDFKTDTLDKIYRKTSEFLWLQFAYEQALAGTRISKKPLACLNILSTQPKIISSKKCQDLCRLALVLVDKIQENVSIKPFFALSAYPCAYYDADDADDAVGFDLASDILVPVPKDGVEIENYYEEKLKPFFSNFTLLNKERHTECAAFSGSALVSNETSNAICQNMDVYDYKDGVLPFFPCCYATKDGGGQHNLLRNPKEAFPKCTSLEASMELDEVTLKKLEASFIPYDTTLWLVWSVYKECVKRLVSNYFSALLENKNDMRFFTLQQSNFAKNAELCSRSRSVNSTLITTAECRHICDELSILDENGDMFSQAQHLKLCRLPGYKPVSSVVGTQRYTNIPHSEIVNAYYMEVKYLIRKKIDAILESKLKEVNSRIENRQADTSSVCDGILAYRFGEDALCVTVCRVLSRLFSQNDLSFLSFLDGLNMFQCRFKKA